MTLATMTEKLLDAKATAAAKAATRAAIRDLLDGPAGPRAVVVTAPAGAGKSHLIAQAMGQAVERGCRTAVAAPTNEQAFGLVRPIATMHPGQTVTFVPRRDMCLPAAIAALPNVQESEAKNANRDELIVGTLSKLGDAFTRGSLGGFDVLLVDEAYQADSAKYYAAAGLARWHLLVGDGGQINPFAVVADPNRWRGLPEDPLQTAVGVLLRNHPATPLHRLPITRRLDGRATPLARVFYPHLPFVPAVLPDVRRLRLLPASGRSERRLDAALNLAAATGWAQLELPRAAVLQTDPEAVECLAGLVQRLLLRSPEVCCERRRSPALLRPEQVAVGVAHNDQKDLVRRALQERKLGGVVVETANKLQGLEFEVVFVWHPLSGLPEADAFHVDPGRLCVLLTRHRQACVVVGRQGDRELVEERLPPPTAAYLGWDPDPVLDGWETHREVFAALAALAVPR